MLSVFKAEHAACLKHSSLFKVNLIPAVLPPLSVRVVFSRPFLSAALIQEWRRTEGILGLSFCFSGPLGSYRALFPALFGFFRKKSPKERFQVLFARPAVFSRWSVVDYERFNRNSFSIHSWSWNYRGCWHQTCPPIVTRRGV